MDKEPVYEEKGMITDDMFWLIAFFLYAVDHVKFLNGREMIIRETAALRLSPTLAPTPFTLTGRGLAILNPFLPYTAVFRFPWLATTSMTSDTLNKTKRDLDAARKRLAPFRAVAVSGSFTYFLVGPITTSFIGLGQTLILIVPLHFLLLALLGFVFSRDGFDLSRRQRAGLIAECLICPMYVPAIVKRLSWRRSQESDGVAFTRENLGAHTFAELMPNVAFRLSDMLEGAEEAERVEIENYKAAIAL